MLQLLTFHPALSLLLSVFQCAVWGHSIGNRYGFEWRHTYRDRAGNIVAVSRLNAGTSDSTVYTRWHYCTAPYGQGSSPDLKEWPYQNEFYLRQPAFRLWTRPKEHPSTMRVVVDVVVDALVGKPPPPPRFEFSQRRISDTGVWGEARAPLWVALVAVVGPSPYLPMFVELPTK